MCESMDKNSCTLQAFGEIPVALNTKIHGIVAREERDRPTLETANTERKYYIIAWSESAVPITSRMVQFPRMATRYMRQMGRESHP